MLVARQGGHPVGCVIAGRIAGADRAARVRLLAVDAGARRQGVGRALLAAALARAFGGGARFVIVELPDDPLLAAAAALFTGAGFLEVARAADVVRDGVALRFLQRPAPR